jgi:hypothetical protein
VRQQLNQSPRNLRLFLDWLGITENAFHYLIDQHRSNKLWERNENWEWQMIDDVLAALSQVSNPEAALELREQHTDFLVTPKGQSTDRAGEYILIGKGYPT